MTGASAKADQALAVPVEPVARLDPSGFDPSRDRTALSHWFPLVEAAGLPVPKTYLVHMPRGVCKTIFAHLWGEDADPTKVQEFIGEMRGVATPLGAPFFLRTDFTSGKHSWDDACFVRDPANLSRHVYAIAEYSEMAGFPGLPWDVWALREMLPTKPIGSCPSYGNMPICKEFRFFVDGGEIECFHPYWPMEAFERGGCEVAADAYAALCDPGDDLDALRALASKAGSAVGGRWSVDLLETERGWFLTDMAAADESYHWPDCTASVGRNAERQDHEDGLGPKDEHAVGSVADETPDA